MAREFYLGPGRVVCWGDMPNPMTFTYPNTSLVPRADTEVESRQQPDTSIQFGPFLLSKPLIAAPMDTVADERVIRMLAKMGGLGTLPRGEVEGNLAVCERLSKDSVPCLYAIGLGSTTEETVAVAGQFKERGAQMILIDIAHGGMRRAGEAGAEIQEKLEIAVVVGNIGTQEQGEALRRRGLVYVRVGVGSGKICITGVTAKVHVPQLSAVFGVSEVDGLYVIADGGLSTGGDLAEAIAGGAKVGMFGSRLGLAKEAPGARDAKGRKQLRGQASTSYMLENGVQPGEFRAAEGIDVFVETGQTLKEIVDEVMGGLRSAMSYVGAKNLEELYKNGQFVYLDPAAQQAAQAHHF